MKGLNLNFNVGAIKNILRQFRQVIAILVLIVVIFLVWDFFVGPQYDKFKNIQQTSAQVSNQLADVNKDLDEIEKLDAEIKESPLEAITKLNKALPFSENLEEFLANMHKLAQQSGLVITNMFVKPDDTQAQSDLKKSQLNMSLRGSYVDVLYYIGLLERHARLIDIHNLSMRNVAAFSAQLASRTGLLQINLTADIYHLEDVPPTPLFPYGRAFDASIFALQQFRELQILSFSLPTDSQNEPDPFSPR